MDKRMTAADAVSELRDGMTLGIGGWGSRRKPMALVREILRSPLRDLTVVTYGGPDAGLLCKYGKVKRLVYGFVSLDSIALEPHFRQARQAGSFRASELDEGMLRINPELRTVRSPYDDAEELVAMPALELDAAIIHMNRADARGNGQFLGPDLYFDDLFCLAAKRRFMSCERIIPTEDFQKEGPLHTLRINRSMVDGVIEAPNGAHFTECPPDYGRDESFQREYAATAKDPQAWEAFKIRYLDVPEEEYQAAVQERSSRSEAKASEGRSDRERNG
jgi:glutaconate CoA-transferase subunit A